MRIRTQLVAALVFSALVCIAMLVSVGVRIKSQAELLAAYDRAQATAQACANLLALTQEYAFYGEPRAAQQWRKRYAEIKANFVEQRTMPQLHSQDVAGLSGNLNRLTELFAALENIPGTTPDALSPRRKQMIVDQLITNTQSVADDAYQLAVDVNEERKLSNERFLQFYIGITIAFVAVISQFAYVILNRILTPLRLLGQAATAVRLGDLTVRNQHLANDELGDLGRKFDAMTESLQKRDLSLLEANTDLAQQVALRTHAEKRIRLITDNLPALIAYVTPDWCYQFANRQFDDMLGIDHQWMVGKHASEVWSADNFNRLAPSAERALAGETMHFDVQLNTEKARLDFRATYVPDFNDDGNVIGFFIMHEDITQRKIADAALKSLNTRFQIATQSGGIGIWEWQIQADRLIADRRMHELYQFSPGKEREKFQGWMERLHPADIDRVGREIQAAVNGTTPYDTEFRIIWPNGEIRTIKASGLLSRSAEDASPVMTGVNWDISELRSAEKAQRESEERLRLFIEGVEEYSIIMLDPRGFIENWNSAAQKMQGYAAEKIIGEHFSIFHTTGSVAAGDPERSLKIAEQTGRFREEAWRLRQDGSQFLGEVAITALRDDLGLLRGFGQVTRDLTSQKQKEQAISTALEEKETLLKEVYHRVKNNLQVIISLLKMQARTLGQGAAYDALTESVSRVRAMSLVHEKLYQSGSLSSIALGDYINELCNDLAMSQGAAARGVRISCDVAPIDMRLETAVPLGLLLNELISNCLKHAFPDGRHGEVRLSLRAEPAGDVIVRVIDDGVGIPAGFDLQGSTSLGLKLATTLCAQLDGSIELVSVHGLEVIIRFPLPRREAPFEGVSSSMHDVVA